MEVISSDTRLNAMPALNKPAPDFEAVTTHGVQKLSDYAGKWLMLFSRPADFTPVCTTEFMAFAKRHDEFQALNTELLDLSIDSHYAHLAWARNIKEKFDVDIPFPIIADLSMDVTYSYGMVQPSGKVIVPPPATAEAAEARINEGYECTDWYFCKRSL